MKGRRAPRELDFIRRNQKTDRLPIVGGGDPTEVNPESDPDADETVLAKADDVFAQKQPRLEANVLNQFRLAHPRKKRIAK